MRCVNFISGLIPLWLNYFHFNVISFFRILLKFRLPSSEKELVSSLSFARREILKPKGEEITSKKLMTFKVINQEVSELHALLF